MSGGLLFLDGNLVYWYLGPGYNLCENQKKAKYCFFLIEVYESLYIKLQKYLLMWEDLVVGAQFNCLTLNLT